MRFYTKTRLSENIHETPEGFLVCVGVPIGRTGEMLYAPGELPLEAGSDGTIVVVRDADALFAPKTIASFEGKSFTVWHPGDFINPENWRELTKGILHNVRRGNGEHENDLLSDVLVTVADAIEKVKAGMREVSLGYDADYVPIGAGRYAQRNILGNHCALVDEGRAGAAYAINDHKGKGSTMSLRDRVKSIFSKAQDDAIKLVDEAEKKDDKEVTAPTNDAVMKRLDALDKKLDAIGKPAKSGKTKDEKACDESTDPHDGEPAKTKAKDEEGDPMEGLAARLTKLEGLVSKIVEKMSASATDEDYGGDDETTDDDMDGDDETTDADESEEKETKAKTGDRKGPGDDEDEDEEELTSRVEILAPGMNARTKDVKRKALVAAYATKDGKKVIERFTGGRKPNFGDKSFVATVFVGAAELLANERTTDFGRAKAHDHKGGVAKDPTSFGLSPDEVNKRNEEHYKASRAT